VPAVDEALVVLAEIVMLAGFAVLAGRLWLGRGETYQAIVAKAINATAPYAETLIFLPQPIHVEPSYVSYKGEKATIPRLARVEGRAYQWLLVYNATTRLARGG
jgi:hypothetical protein